MAKPPAKFPRLKVFRAQIGFFETVVAASSRPKALAAWGSHQDLFAHGEAVELDRSDPAAETALARPGEPLTRPVGSKGPFKPGAEGRPDVPAPKGKAKATGKPPDRTALDKAEAALQRLTKTEADTIGRLEAERRTIDRKIASAREALDRRREAAEAEVEKAREAYRAAGGQGSASWSARSTR